MRTSTIKAESKPQILFQTYLDGDYKTSNRPCVQCAFTAMVGLGIRKTWAATSELENEDRVFLAIQVIRKPSKISCANEVLCSLTESQCANAYKIPTLIASGS